jgi:hypothetical protein
MIAKATFTFQVISDHYLHYDLEDLSVADHVAECLERYLKSELMVPVKLIPLGRELWDGSSVYCNVEYPQEPRLKPV